MTFLVAPTDHPVAVYASGETWDRATLLRHALPLADALTRRPGSHVVIALEARLDIGLALLAALYARKIAVLPGSLGKDVLATLPQDAVVVVRGDPRPGDLDLDALPTSPNRPIPADLGCWRDDDEPMLILATSGSTGTPKHVVKTQGQIRKEVAAHLIALVLPQAPVLCLVSAQHIYGLLFGVLRPWMGGIPMVAETPRLPADIETCARATGARTLVAVPAQLRVLADPIFPTFSAFERVISSAGPLPPETGQHWHTCFSRDITEVFGSTETGGIATREQRISPLWTPFSDLRVQADTDGRLLLDSPWAPADPHGLYATDDRVALHADGRFEHLGRLDDIVKVAGVRVSLKAIESQILRFEGVRDAFVFTRADEARGVRIHALVTPADTSLDALRAHLRAHLPAVALPRLLATDAIARNAQGKPSHTGASALFADALAEDALLTRIATEGLRARATFCVPHDHVLFEGHFPQSPVLPGVALIEHGFAALVRQAWPELGSLQSIPKFHFLQPVLPAVSLTLEATRSAQTPRVDVLAFDDSHTPCAKGTLLFGGISHDKHGL